MDDSAQRGMKVNESRQTTIRKKLGGLKWMKVEERG